MNTEARFLFRYIQLQLKRGFLCLPKMLIGILVLLLCIGGFILAAGKLMEDYKEKQKLSLAVSLPKEGAAEEWMFNILEDMDSINENCRLLRVDTEKALSMLKEGSVYGAVIIPKGFVNGIMTGENRPAEIYLPDSPLQKELISLLSSSGAESLASAQAGIYAISDFAIENKLTAALPKILEDLNREYISFTLSRADYFHHVSLEESNSLPITLQYAASGMTLFLLLCLISMAKLLRSESRALKTKLHISGISPSSATAVQTLLVFALLSLIALAILIPFCVYSSKVNNLEVAYIPAVIGAFFAAFSIASFGVLVYTAAKTEVAAMLFLFLSSVFMLFVSGGILPLYLLPTAISRFSIFMPTAAIQKCMSMAFSGEHFAVLPSLAFGIIFLSLSMLLANRQFKSKKGVLKL